MILSDTKLRWLILAGVLVGIFEFLSLGGIRLPIETAIPVFTILILAIGHETLWKGIKALVQFKIQNINFLMVLAVIGAFYLGEFEEAAVLIVLFTLAERLEDVGIAKSKSSLDKLIDKMPKVALLKGKDKPVEISEIQIGDVIIIKPFQVIPLDGEVTSGSSYVDESTITGEPLPQDKRIGDGVFAGTMNKQGILELKVTKKSGDTTIDKIREITFEATQHKAETQKFIEKFSTYYTPGVIILAIVWLIFPSERTFDQALVQSLSILVIACPCALVISTPISIFSAIGNASASGALIKGGRYLEAIGNVKAIAFDKTRTLTFGEPIVTDVIPFGKNTRESLLSCAAGVELFSEHPLAQSVVEAARREDLTPHEVDNFESVVGKGAKADCLVCHDKHHCIGKLEFILEEHHVSDEVLQTITNLQQQGKTVIIISTHQEVEGVIAIEDEIRPEAAEMIKDIDKMKISSEMLTGDHRITANAVAKQVGIQVVKAELLPQDKSDEIKNMLEKYGTVAMVGDGVNDAPALALANVGISMMSLGSDTALEAASIVILNDHLTMIPYLIRLGKRTLNMIRFNTALAIGIKFIVIILSLLGLTSLALAILADVGVTVLVILNSLRLMR